MCLSGSKGEEKAKAKADAMIGNRKTKKFKNYTLKTKLFFVVYNIRIDFCFRI
jgi:hypothetical protein